VEDVFSASVVLPSHSCCAADENCALFFCDEGCGSVESGSAVSGQGQSVLVLVVFKRIFLEWVAVVLDVVSFEIGCDKKYL